MSKSINYIRAMVLGALLASIAVILKLTLNIETTLFRISIFEIPIMLSGFILGPLFGGLVGFITDFIYMAVKGWPMSLMTLSSILWGVVPGVFIVFFRKQKRWPSLISIVVILTAIICFLINTYQLYLWSGPASFAQMPMRIVILITKIPIQISLIMILTDAYDTIRSDRSNPAVRSNTVLTSKNYFTSGLIFTTVFAIIYYLIITFVITNINVTYTLLSPIYLGTIVPLPFYLLGFISGLVDIFKDRQTKQIRAYTVFNEIFLILSIGILLNHLVF